MSKRNPGLMAVPIAGALSLLLGAAPGAHAAPLDAFLTAEHPAERFRPEVEVSYDMANRSIDFLGLRPKRADGSYGPSGKYNGEHLRLGMNLAPSVWVDGALWNRTISYASVGAHVTSWQLAGQYKWLDGGGSGPSLALRASTWGDSAPELRKTTAVDVAGVTFTSARETRPRDLQFQADLIGTWPVSRTLSLSGFVGGGRSRVDFDQVTATTQSGGCQYDVQFTDTNVIATCDQNGNGVRISVPNSAYGIDVNEEARYSATYLSAGASGSWIPGGYESWRLRGGYQYTSSSRSNVDAIIAARGGVAYKSNQVFLAEIGYKAWPQLMTFVRVQVTRHQFVGEIPLNYNSLTAPQQRLRYGLLSVGLIYGF